MKDKKEKVGITPKAEELPKEEPQGRQQEEYFFPDYMRTIKAGSLKEATQKIKEGEK